MSITTVNAELNAILKNRRYQYSKKEWTRTITFADKRDTINPEANEHRRESAAEAGIIYYLYNNHDACGDVLKRLPPDKFVTSFNRRVYEEVGKITEILEKYSELGIDAKVAEDYINVLLNYKPKEKQEDISDDDFFKKFEEMRKKN